MNWVKDEQDRLVNIDNWDFLNYQTISDKKTDLPIVYKIYLERHGEEQVLGYIACEHEDGEEIIERISKGVAVHLSTLESALYYLLDREFDEEMGKMPLDANGFDAAYNKRKKEIEKMIGKRFVED
ncbi:MAG TPA: hypothetical protein VMR37_03575 [Rhabdochlamydiaceae bacterium]|nr:hypothetical protein [Rhabdochlamydiaceae bacterium]